MKDYYAILEVPPTASREAIREQYLLLIQAWHPDKFPNPAQKAKAEEKCKEINIAYAVLNDARKRLKYDRERGAGPSQSAAEERRRRAEEVRQRRQADDAEQRHYREQQRQQTEEAWRQAEEQRPQAGPAEAEQSRLEHERQARVQEEWIRVYFEQARRRQSAQPPAGVTHASQGSIRVLIVDDLPGTRAQLRALLSSEADIRVVGEAANGLDAVRQFDALMPDVVITGMDHPNLDSLAATEAILREHPLSRVIILSAQSSTDYIRRAAMTGACDYLTKPVQTDELRSAIRLAAAR